MSMVYDLEWWISYSTQAVVVVFGLFLFFTITMFVSALWGAPWVITSKEVIGRVLELAQLNEGDLVVDLGAGDGRVLIAAAQKYGVNGRGIEIDPVRCLLARFFIQRRGLADKVKISWGNIYSAEIAGADVVLMYLTRETNRKLKTLLEDNLKPGARVISYAFTIPGWVPVMIDNQDLIFIYEIGQTGSDTLTEFV